MRLLILAAVATALTAGGDVAFGAGRAAAQPAHRRHRRPGDGLSAAAALRRLWVGHRSRPERARRNAARSAERSLTRTSVTSKKARPSGRAFLLGAAPCRFVLWRAGRSKSGRDRCTRPAARSSFLTISPRRSREAATDRSPGSTRRSRTCTTSPAFRLAQAIRPGSRPMRRRRPTRRRSRKSSVPARPSSARRSATSCSSASPA